MDDFFRNDADDYLRQLLGKSYCYTLDENPNVIVCAFTLSNSSMDVKRLPNNRKMKVITDIPREKHLSSYPAMLIGRVGVNKDFGKQGIGSELIGFICSVAKSDHNWASCRFVTVDAYNNKNALKYYDTNGFRYLFSTEQQEKQHIGMPEDKELKTRLMYFDLLQL
ncbi:MAG: GNAT family N-acetyltransferase [Dysgonamonadaceae bacterium]|nr:GNAT family N-acetyltransferase [Dysgonamonadaceae bacterium]